LLKRESGRIQSNHRALRQPLPMACARSPPIYLFFLTSGNIRPPS
jgi:hypothetical protein